MARERSENGAELPLEQPQPDLTIAEIRQLVSLMNGSDIEELTIEHEQTGLKLVLRKPAPTEIVTHEADLVDGDEIVATDGETEASAPHAQIRAPLVGIYHMSMKADGKPLVSVGDTVKTGQIVAAIESLNVLNEVEATVSGRVMEIMASDGQPVEYGQALLVIETEPA
jgi:biotin carboxyl carrier protein